MQCYVTENFDFYAAIYAGVWRQSHGFNITSVSEVDDKSAIVKTTHGKFYCESFEDKDANVYMKVFPILPDVMAQQNDIEENQDNTQQTHAG